MTLYDAITLYISARTGEVAPATLVWYRRRLETLAAFYGDRDVATLTTADLYHWRAFLVERETRYDNHPTRPQVNTRGLSPYTLHGHVRAVRTFCHWLAAGGYIEADIAAPLKLPRLPKNRIPKAVSEEDLDAILAAASENPRDYALLQFMADTGCRRAGAAGLRLGDVDLEAGTATVTEKGEKTRTVYLTEEPVAALRAWLRVRPPVAHDYVWVSQKGGGLTPDGINMLLRRLGERAGCAHSVNPHGLRHRAAREMLNNGASLDVVQEILGHEDIQTTRVYAVWTARELQEKHREFSPQRNRRRRDN